MQTFDQSLTAGQTCYMPGGFQFLLLASSADVDVTFFGPNKEHLDEAKGIKQGLSVKYKDGFSSVEITSAVIQTIKIGISSIASAEYNQLPDLSIEAPAEFISIADVSLNNGSITTLLAANTSRRKTMISSLVANIVEIRVGDSNTTASRGTPLQPGETCEIETQGAIYAFSTIASQKTAITYTQG